MDYDKIQLKIFPENAEEISQLEDLKGENQETKVTTIDYASLPKIE